MAATMSDYHLFFSPANLPHDWLVNLGILSILMLLVMLWQLRDLWLSRLLALAAMALLLFQPFFSQNTLAPVDPIAIIAVDQSPSMQLGDRPKQTEKIIETLQDKLLDAQLELKQINLAQSATHDTKLFSELMPLIRHENPARIAAVFLITDGQISDTDKAMPWPTDGPPLHTILVDKPNMQQAYIELTQPPDFAIVGDRITLRLRAHWPSQLNGNDETILGLYADDHLSEHKIPLNQWIDLPVVISHPGMNSFILSLPAFRDAVFPATQTAVVNINGIINQTKILWQSSTENPPEYLNNIIGNPNITWVSDRQTTDFGQYDLVILHEILTVQMPDEKWQNALNDYVQHGGNLLWIQSNGPKDALAPKLANLLPLTWQNAATSSLIVPDKYWTHPLVAEIVPDINALSLASAALETPDSAADFLIRNQQNKIVLGLSDNLPGRIAMIAQEDLLNTSPGPKILQNTLRWLIHDPNLSDHEIYARKNEEAAQIEYLGSRNRIISLEVTRPDRSRFELPLNPGDAGLRTAEFPLDQQGAYILSDGKIQRTLVNGNIMVPEFQSAAATSHNLSTLTSLTRGSTIWFSQTPEFELKWVTQAQSGSGNWLPLRTSRAMISTGSTTYPLLPKFLLLLTIAAALAYAWWRESR